MKFEHVFDALDKEIERNNLDLYLSQERIKAFEKENADLLARVDALEKECERKDAAIEKASKEIKILLEKGNEHDTL